MKPTILIAEDEENLLSTLVLNFELEGYNVIAAENGREALEKFNSRGADLLVLDIMMPGMSGIEVCKKIREYNKQVPVLFLTARNSSVEKIEGLKTGADDYMTKPFNLEELLLRAENLIRRASLNKVQDNAQGHKIYRFGDFEINFSTFEVVGVHKQKHTLNKKEMLMLKLLIEKKNEVVSRDEIMEKIWGEEVYSTPRTIDNYILAFRKYFEYYPKHPRHFFTMRGIGYKFVE